MSWPDYGRSIRETWAAIEAEGDRLTERFYERLFEINPGARVLFARSDLAAQRVKLMATLREIVALCEDPERLVRSLVPLGRRHAGYGVSADDYTTAARALVRALHETLGDRMTDEAAEAWRELVHIVSGVMLRAGQQSSEEHAHAGDRPDRPPAGRSAE